MDFVDRASEMARLDRLAERDTGGFAVVWGRRRIGKTRLLVEWCGRRGGLYTVADQSAPDIQRRYFAEAVARRLPGFADVEYRDWGSLLARLAREARFADWRGPIVFDEFPYAVAASGELPSVVQRWLDHEARDAGLVIAIAGSSQRMMQGLVLDESAPLFGRAHELLELQPLGFEFVPRVFSARHVRQHVAFHAAWGGVPRYWELATETRGSLPTRIDHLVLDPLGPLHREPDRLLIEELPPAMEVRPVLDAIGLGAHRVSEIAGRLGRPATSLSRPLARLLEMGLVERQVPFGESEKKGRRSLYRLADPFFRLWFRVVAPHRAVLAVSPRRARLELFDRYWSHLQAAAWESLCRACVSRLPNDSARGLGGPWGPASRWWRGNAPEWDVVAESLDGNRLLLGEAKWSATPFSAAAVEEELEKLRRRSPPDLPARYGRHETVRALFVPEVEGEAGGALFGGLVVTARSLLEAR